MAAVAQKFVTAEEFVAWSPARPTEHWELFDGAAQMQESQRWGHQQVVLTLYRLICDAVKHAKLDLGCDPSPSK
jgi:hypothetical protein